MMMVMMMMMITTMGYKAVYRLQNVNTANPHRRYDVVAGLAWSKDPESYASSSTATGWGSHARQAKGDYPDKKRYPGPPGWGLGVGLTTPPCKSWICF
jgi:hypothetical protein